MESLDSFSKIAAKYRVIFFDAYGVLKNSSGIINGVPDILAGLARDGKDFYVITNDASRSPARMEKAYRHPEHGNLIPAEKNISSGMLTQDFLAARVQAGGAVAYLGKPGAAHYIESAGLEAVPISEAEDPEALQALVLMDDEGFDWFTDLNKAVNIVRKVNIPVIVANTDMTYPVRGNEVAIAVGSLANMIEPIVRKTLYRFGKPDTQIFSFAYARVRAALPDIQKREVLMVGDTLGTDILGANKFGIDTALVLSGNTQRTNFELLISSSGIIPTYVCESIMT